MDSRQTHDVARRRPYDTNVVSPSTDQSWRNQAACVGYPPEWWFPPTTVGRKPGTHQPGKAEAICAVCPVTLQCVVEAKRTRSTDGIWGGKRR